MSIESAAAERPLRPDVTRRTVIEKEELKNFGSPIRRRRRCRWRSD
jgi:hypothetical protein